MTDDTPDQTGPDKGLTSPSEPTHEATTPPGENRPDPERLKEAEEQLEQPGAGH